MIEAVITLSIILYLVMGIFIGLKQYKAFFNKGRKTQEESEITGWLAGFFWPIVLVGYIFRVVFFEEWI